MRSFSNNRRDAVSADQIPESVVAYFMAKSGCMTSDPNVYVVFVSCCYLVHFLSFLTLFLLLNVFLVLFFVFLHYSLKLIAASTHLFLFNVIRDAQAFRVLRTGEEDEKAMLTMQDLMHSLHEKGIVLAKPSYYVG
jgi:hypothetical protein